MRVMKWDDNYLRMMKLNMGVFLRKYIDEILLKMTDVEERRCAYLHLYGVAQAS